MGDYLVFFEGFIPRADQGTVVPHARVCQIDGGCHVWEKRRMSLLISVGTFKSSNKLWSRLKPSKTKRFRVKRNLLCDIKRIRPFVRVIDVFVSATIFEDRRRWQGAWTISQTESFEFGIFINRSLRGLHC